MLADAQEVFRGTGVKFTVRGRYIQELALVPKNSKTSTAMAKWCQQLGSPIPISLMPAYAAYVHSLQHKYTYFSEQLKTSENISSLSDQH